MSQALQRLLPNEGRGLSDETREANHRIANNLSLLVGSLHLQARAVEREQRAYTAREVRLLLDDAAARLRAIAELHTTLSQAFAGETVDLGAHVKRVGDALVQACADESTVSISYDLADCQTAAERARVIGSIVAELVTNAIKYAHPAGVQGAIEVRCRRSAKTITIEVSDDGVGLPEGFDPDTATSVGFAMLRMLARQIEAHVSFRDEGLGLTVAVHVPA